MGESAEHAFIEELLRRDLVSRETLGECQRLVEQSRATGVGGANLRDTLVSKGLLTADQAEEVWRHSLGSRPQVIAGYELLQKLGQGGMGIVYRPARPTAAERLP